MFYFVNDEKEHRLDAYVAFAKLTNLKPDDFEIDKETGEKHWHFVLEPGEKKAFHLRRKDFQMKFGLAHKSSFKLLKPGESPRKFT